MDKIVKVETRGRYPHEVLFERVPAGPGSWYCRDCHVLHVMTDECPATGRRRAET